MNSLRQVWQVISVALLIAALIMPGLAQNTVISTAQASAAASPDDLPRFHADGWADDQSLARAEEWLANFAAERSSRPKVDPAAQRANTADWTVLVFIAGDNNLEEAGLYDINEMEAVGFIAGCQYRGPDRPLAELFARGWQLDRLAALLYSAG